MATSIYIPTNSAKVFLFSTPSLEFILCRLFDDGHSDQCEVVPHWSFDLYFSNISDVEHLFTCLLTICIKMVVLKSLKTNSIVLLWIVWLQVILAMQFYFPDCNYQQFSSLAQSCLTLCDRMDCSMPGFPVHHQLLEFTQTHVHWVSDAIQPSHPLLSPSPPAFSLS